MALFPNRSAGRFGDWTNRERKPKAQKKRPSQLNPVPAGLNLSPELPKSVMPTNTSALPQVGPMLDMRGQLASPAPAQPANQGAAKPGLAGFGPKGVNLEGALEPAILPTMITVPEVGPVLDLTKELNLPPKFGNKFANISMEDAAPTGDTLAGLQGAAPQPQAAAPQPQAGLGIMPSPSQEAPVHRGLPSSMDVTGMNPVEKHRAMQDAQNYIPSSAGDYVSKDGVRASEFHDWLRQEGKKADARTFGGGHYRRTGPGGRIIEGVHPMTPMAGTPLSAAELAEYQALTAPPVQRTQADMERALDGVVRRGGSRRADGGWRGTNTTGLTPSERREAIYALQAGEEVPDELLRGTSPNEVARLERAAGRADRAAQARADRMNSPAGMAAMMKGMARRNRMGLGPAPTLGNAMAMAGNEEARRGAILGGRGLAGVQAEEARARAGVEQARIGALGQMAMQEIANKGKLDLQELANSQGVTPGQIAYALASNPNIPAEMIPMLLEQAGGGAQAGGTPGVQGAAPARAPVKPAPLPSNATPEQRAKHKQQMIEYNTAQASTTPGLSHWLEAVLDRYAPGPSDVSHQGGLLQGRPRTFRYTPGLAPST